MAGVDLAYRPGVQDLAWAAPFSPTVALILGRPTEQLLAALLPLGVEVRSTDDRAVALLRGGVYVLNGPEDCALVVVPSGQEAPAEEAADRDATGHLGNVSAVYDGWWPHAVPVSVTAPFQPGDYVRPRGERSIGTVVKTVLQVGGYDVHVRLDGRSRAFDETDLERVLGDPDDPAFWMQQALGSARDLAFTLTYTKLRHPLSDVLYSFASSKTLFRPYQFVPVIKLLNSPSGRLLIADEVGLGKTIEAGLIWTELEQRERLRRVLVVAPAALVQKWKAEMRRRFDRPVKVATLADMREFAAEVRRGRDEELHAVISMQALRRANDVLEQLQEVNPAFDLVIVDEAHAMRNRGTSTYDLGQLLSDWSDNLVFLSATPLNLGRNDLFNLVNLLDAEQFDDQSVFESQLEPNKVLNGVLRQLATADADPRKLLASLDDIHSMQLGGLVTERPDYALLRDVFDTAEPLGTADRARAKRLINELNTLSSVFTRTRKADVPDAKAEREAVQVDVEWTEQERSFYEGVRRLYLARAKARGVPKGFALQMPLRQAASCIPAMQAMLGRTDFDDVRVQVLEDEDDEGYGLPVDEIDADEYRELMGLNAPITHDTKFEALRSRLLLARERGMSQAMIFSFFKGTLRYLADRLGADFTVRVLSGDTKMLDREIVMEDFRDGRFELLLLSQVGSEGLDFEFCNVLVNYDLPWNPMQVEQRIGRLDRFGQQHEKIFIFNMHIPGTIETDIFERLYHRIGLFKESIGELEPILRDDLEAWTNQLMDPSLNEAQREQQSRRIADAIELKRLQVKELGESSALLSTIDVLAIDGMTEHGPTDGRYVGQSEVRRVLDAAFARFGGSIGVADAEGRSVLRGTAELASALSRSRVSRQGSMYSVQHLAQLLRDGDDIAVTFASDTASRHNVELLSSRHPLVALALLAFSEDEIALRRFGHVGVPGIGSGKRFAVRIDLCRTTGLRPRTDLWTSAIDLGTGTPVEDLEGPLLTALAEGTFEEVVADPVDVPLSALEALVSARRRDVGAQRRRDNEAIVEGRIASRQQGITRKIHRAELQLDEQQAKGGDPRIQRLHEGRIRNLRNDLVEITASLEHRKALTVSNDPVAILVVHGL